MHRCIRFALGLVLILSASAGTASAQGWGWGGWGGWGQTPQGAIAQGMGYYNMGTGMGNLYTAQARSINADTYMRWNQYWYEAHLEATRRYVAKRDGDATKNKAAYNEYIKNLQDHPTARDVENGDALNAALDQLADPAISSSSLKIATAPIDAKIIADIPFRNASEAVTIVLSQVKEAKKWPAALDGDRFIDDKRIFDEIAEKARKEDEEGEISSDTLRKAHNLVNSLQGKLAAQPSGRCQGTTGGVPVRQDPLGIGSDARKAGHQGRARSVTNGQDHDPRQPDRVHARLQLAVRGGHQSSSEIHLRPALPNARRRP